MCADKLSFLKVTDLEVYYGGIHALTHVNLHVDQGEIVAVIGANGAGKSTLLKTIAGVKSYTGGDITLEGQTLPKQSYQVVRAGVTLVPEGRRIFAALTVNENLLLGAYSKPDPARTAQAMTRVFDIFPVLAERRNQRGGTLSGGEQQMLAIGRALMSEPRLLLLDEPSLGLAPLIVDLLFDTVVRLNREMGITVLVVEQNASLALELCDRAYVLETGAIQFEGLGEALLSDPRVRESYLGVAA
jgi:branched-chain amino acid transport system ATP-binding protein